jgi:hypothetical protein
MKTPIKQLIEEIRSLAFTDCHVGTGDIVLSQGHIDELEEKYIQKEKDEISIAYNNGIKNPYTNIWVQLSQRETTRGEIYYEERYKQTK